MSWEQREAQLEKQLETWLRANNYGTSKLEPFATDAQVGMPHKSPWVLYAQYLMWALTDHMSLFIYSIVHKMHLSSQRVTQVLLQ